MEPASAAQREVAHCFWGFWGFWGFYFPPTREFAEVREVFTCANVRAAAETNPQTPQNPHLSLRVCLPPVHKLPVPISVPKSERSSIRVIHAEEGARFHRPSTPGGDL